MRERVELDPPVIYSLSTGRRRLGTAVVVIQKVLLPSLVPRRTRRAFLFFLAKFGSVIRPTAIFDKIYVP